MSIEIYECMAAILIQPTTLVKTGCLHTGEPYCLVYDDKCLSSPNVVLKSGGFEGSCRSLVIVGKPKKVSPDVSEDVSIRGISLDALTSKQ